MAEAVSAALKAAARSGCLTDAVRGAARVAGVVHSLQTAIGCLGLLLARKKRGTTPSRVWRVISDADSLRLTASVGSMIAIYRALCCVLRHSHAAGSHTHSRAGKSADDEISASRAAAAEPKWIPLAAGAVAGLALAIDTNPDRRTTITLYAFARALSYAVRDLSYRGVIPRIPHGSVWLFQVCCFEIMYEWFYSPDNLPKSYVKWISKLACMDPHLLLTLRTYATEPSHVVMTHLARYCAGQQPPLPSGPGTFADPYSRLINCCVVHPHSVGGFGSIGIGTETGARAGGWAWRWCMHNSWRRFAVAFRIALTQVYMPVHFIPLILFKLRAALNAAIASARSSAAPNVIAVARPATRTLAALIASAGLGAMRSSAFIASFVAIIWSCVCFMRNLTGDDTRFGPALGSALCGLSLFIEHPSRRDELALYCVPRALQGLWSRIGLPTSQRALIPLFSVSLGWMMFVAHNQHLAFNASPPPPPPPTASSTNGDNGTKNGVAAATVNGHSASPAPANAFPFLIKPSHLRFIQFFFGEPPALRTVKQL